MPRVTTAFAVGAAATVSVANPSAAAAAAASASPPFTFQRTNGSVVCGCCAPRQNSTDGSVTFAGNFSSAQACEDACGADPTCQSYTWEDATGYGDAAFHLLCYHRHDDTYDVVQDPVAGQHDGHFSGRKCPGGASSPYSPNWCSVTQHPTPAWFNRAKFGIYAHWGPYSVPAFGTEWYSRNMYVNGSSVNEHHVATYGADFGYKDFIPMFTAENFDAEEWAALYQRAGARYAGPVAEHADGFAMYDSKLSSFTAAKMGPKRDVTAEITAAVRRRGMKVVNTLHHQWLWGWYPTWDNNTDCADVDLELTPAHGGLYGPHTDSAASFSPPFNTTPASQDYWLGKSLEVARFYAADLIYFDSRWAALIDDAHRLDFLAAYYNQADEMIKNGSATGVVVTYKSTDLEVGAGTLDFERGGVADILALPWQTDDSIDRHSWSWVNPPSLKNSTELIGELVDIVSKNGNFLLDVTPHANGTQDPAVIATLHEMGDWLQTNGQAIYSTTPHAWFGEGPTKIIPGGFHEWPIFTPHDFRFTRAGSVLFATAMAWHDGSGEYVVTTLNSSVPVAKTITDVAFVGAGDLPGLAWAVESDGLHITGLPAQPPNGTALAFVFRLHLDGSRAGFLLFDGPHPGAVPGAATQLTWTSAVLADTQPQSAGGKSNGRGDTDDGDDDGNDNAAGLVTLEYRSPAEASSHRRGGRGAGRWVPIAQAVPNSGAYEWTVPRNLAPGGVVEVRVRSTGDMRVHDVVEVALWAATADDAAAAQA